FAGRRVGCKRSETVFPSPHRVAMTCAQIAIMPRNSASDVRAAASSTNARNITNSRSLEQEVNIVHFMFQSQGKICQSERGLPSIACQGKPDCKENPDGTEVENVGSDQSESTGNERACRTQGSLLLVLLQVTARRENADLRS